MKPNFLILETITIWLKEGVRCSVVSLTFAKVLIQFELIEGKMWLVIKDPILMLKQKCCMQGRDAGGLSREIDILQGTGQGRILTPFTYKVYKIAS